MVFSINFTWQEPALFALLAEALHLKEQSVVESALSLVIKGCQYDNGIMLHRLAVVYKRNCVRFYVPLFGCPLLVQFVIIVFAMEKKFTDLPYSTNY